MIKTMMIDRRLINMAPDSKKYIALNVALQWCGLTANIMMMTAIAGMLAALFMSSTFYAFFGKNMTFRPTGRTSCHFTPSVIACA